MSEVQLSAVVPVYNEIECVDDLVSELGARLADTGRSFEVVLVDDGSTDGTGERLDALARAHPFVRVVHFERNAGHPGAVAADRRRSIGG